CGLEGSTPRTISRAYGFFVRNLLADLAQHGGTRGFDLWPPGRLRMVVLLSCCLCAKDDHTVSPDFGCRNLLGLVARNKASRLESPVRSRSLFPFHYPGNAKHNQYRRAPLSAGLSISIHYVRR